MLPPRDRIAHLPATSARTGTPRPDPMIRTPIHRPATPRWRALRLLAIGLLLALAPVACGSEEAGSGTDAAPASSADPEAPESGAAGDAEGTSDAVELSPVSSAGDAARATHDVSGRLVDPEGQPVADARVVATALRSAFPLRLGEPFDAAWTGRDGAFTVRAPVGEDFVLECIADGFSHITFRPPEIGDELLIALPVGFAVNGIVVDARNRPVAGAEVHLHPTQFEFRRGRTTRTDGRGRFVFEGVGAGSTGLVRLEARHADLRPATLNNVPVASGEFVRLRLDNEPATPWGGVVRRLDGSTVADALVEVFPGVGWNAQAMVPYAARSDAEGRFELRGLGRGNAVVTVRHPELSTVVRALPIRDSSPRLSVDMVPRIPVRGRLTGDVTPGLQLVLTARDGERTRTVCTADGSFAFAQPASIGLSSLEIVGGVRAFEESGAREVTLEIEDGEPAVLEHAVVVPSRVRGRIVASGGAPLGGAMVSVARYLQVRNPVRWTTISARDGTFSLDGLANGTVELLIEHPEQADRRLSVEVPPVQETLDLGDVVMEGGGQVSGTVTRDGRPVRGAVVTVSDQQSNGAVAVSGEDGRYVVRRLAPGGYGVFARYSTLPVRAAPEAIQVVDGETRDGVDFDFVHGRRIAGRVVDESGQPVRDALVFVLGVGAPPATSEENGEFVVDAPNEEARLQAMAPDGRIRSEPVVVSSDVGEVQLELPWVERGAIEARVFGLPGPTPLSEVIVRLRPLDARDDGRREHVAQRLVEAKSIQLVAGRMVWEDAPAGVSELEIHAHGFVPYVGRVEVSEGERADLGEVRLEPGARFRGVVVDAAGVPVAGAGIYVGRWEDIRESAGSGATSDAEGRFTVSGVSPRSARILVAKDGYTVAEHLVQFPDDLLRDDPVPFVLRDATVIDLVTLSEGRPIEAPRVIVMMRDDRVMAFTLAGVAGKARFICPLPGTYRISEFGGAGEAAVVEVTDQPQELTVELELAPGR